MPDFPLPSHTPTRDEIKAEVLAVADEYGLPRDMLLGLCMAESGEGLQSFERWHRWTTEAQVYIDRRDKNGLRDILQRCAAVPTNDISFGPAHQTWRWSPEFAATGGQPYDLDAILKFRAQYIENPGHAIRTAADQLKRFWTAHGPDKVEAMSRYNKPDGTAAASVRQRYADMLAKAQVELEETEPAPMPPSPVVYEDYRDPGHALFAKQPKGVVLHGSRSGVASNPIEKEYVGTANWELNNPNGYAWHATIGENKVALHLTPKEWGQHDPWASQEYLGVEFAQPTVNNPITDAQVAAFADWFKTRVLPAWPSIPLHFPSHAEVDREYGQNQGKTDVYGLNDSRMDELRSRIMTALGMETPMPSVYAVGPGVLAKMAETGDQPASDELFFKHGDKDEWSETYGQSGSKYVYIFSLNRTFRYAPAA